MDEFFRVWKKAKKHYGLERTVRVNSDEAYMRIYLDGKIIVRVDGTQDDLEILYTQAAQRLLSWMQQREKKA